ncbi:MAG TPA: cytochrome c [Acidobacteriaceae bacterium]|nr:cytochrome c [Acidobacteriaceae bacterium]
MKLAMALALAAWMGPMAKAADDGWLMRVPEKAHVRSNPMARDTDAAAAGKKMFERNCASCHGMDARGHGAWPSLRSARVQQATDGDLEWLLKNGALAHGMPSWSRLPEGERWQLVRYLRTLPLE